MTSGTVEDERQWVLVPREPTPEMIGAWYRYKSGYRFPSEEPARDTSDYGAYAAMLASAPSRPVEAGELVPVAWYEQIPIQPLVENLVRECERAMKQRDEALADPTKRGADGRTHDTIFEHIVREYLQTLPAPALQARVEELEAQIARMEYSDGDAEHWRHLAEHASTRLREAEAEILRLKRSCGEA